MREIKPMWNMVRLLRDNRSEWAVEEALAQAYDINKTRIDSLEGTPEHDEYLNQATTLHISLSDSYQEDVSVYQNRLLLPYINKYMWKSSRRIDITRDKKIQRELVEAKLVLRNCINHVPPFIKKDKDSVCLTADGESFSDFFGLIKQYVLEIDRLWLYISAIIIAILGYLPTIFSYITKAAH
jgi:hypothetical protein